jgi:RAD51-like protein 2
MMATQATRTISTLQISAAYRSKLIKNGYTTVADIQAVSAEELSRDLGVSLEDANTILAAVHSQTQLPIQNALISMGPSASQRPHIAIGGSQTAAELLRVPVSATALSVGVKAIDELLEGGAVKGSVLEISGVPGSGRSAAARSVFSSAVKAGHGILVIGELP